MFFWAALFWSIAILYFCLEDANSLPMVDITHIDKVIHAFIHFVFTVLWFFYLKKNISSSYIIKPLINSFVSSFFFGILVEFLQGYFTATRTADVYDILANIVGATLAVIAIFMLNKYSRIIDKI